SSFSREPCPGPPKWYALKARAGSFSIDHNLAHYAAINRGAGLVRVASLSLLTRGESSAALISCMSAIGPKQTCPVECKSPLLTQADLVAHNRRSKDATVQCSAITFYRRITRLQMNTTQGPAPIEFWFDFASGYAYFAALEIEALAERHGRNVLWRPF